MGAWLGKLESFESTHCLIDRRTGRKITEPTPLTKSLRTGLLYNTWIGRLLLRLPLTWWLLSWEHKRIAAYANSPTSKKRIPSMIKAFRIDMSEAERPPNAYATLQDFFARELKAGARPVAEPDNPTVAVHCADSRHVAFPTVPEAKRLWIKGKNFTVPALLGRGYSAADWSDCAIAVNRLSPADCHRLHAPVTGRVVRTTRLGHRFMASMWVSVHSSLDVMSENERLVMEFETEHFGPVVLVAIGASDVGSVQPLVKDGASVNKGDEVAVFAYGGSITATVFKRGRIQFDEDLLRNSERDCETRCLIGQSLGRATHAAPPAGQ